MPGRYSASKPAMRLNRINVSISVLSSACPRCRFPVTFGGGITIVKGSLPLLASARNGSERHFCAHFGSMALGSN